MPLMIHRPRFYPAPHIYPPDEWNVVEKRFMPDLIEQGETMFALGNGYLGMRGCFEEGGPVGQNGSFINGFYEAWPILSRGGVWIGDQRADHRQCDRQQDHQTVRG
jgi:alpha,alpha-trehalose phosphorylase